MALQTPIQPRARGVRVQELPHHGQQVIKRDQKRPAQRHRDGFLCPLSSFASKRLPGSGRQRRLQPMRRVAAIPIAVTLAPFIYRLRCHPKAFGKNCPSITAGLNGSPDLRPGCRLLVKMDQHSRTPSRMSRRTDLAMNRADRRGEM